jgi:hypothetical protein
MAQNNPRLKEKVDRIFSGAELVAVPHTEILTELAEKRNLLCAPGRSIHGVISFFIPESTSQSGLQNRARLCRNITRAE